MLTSEPNMAHAQKRLVRQLRIWNRPVARAPLLPLQPQARGQRESWAHALTRKKETGLSWLSISTIRVPSVAPGPEARKVDRRAAPFEFVEKV